MVAPPERFAIGWFGRNPRRVLDPAASRGTGRTVATGALLSCS